MTTRANIRQRALLLVQNRDDLTNISSGGAQGLDLANTCFSSAYLSLCTKGYFHGKTDHRPGYYRQIKVKALETSYIVTLSYSTGTISATNGSAAITGSGTAWLTQMTAGDYILINSVAYVISYVSSDTAATLTNNFNETTASGLTYALYQGRYNLNTSVYNILSVFNYTDNQPIVGDSYNGYMMRQRTNGVPATFCTWQNSLLIDPSPSKVTTIGVMTRNKPVAITDDSTAIVIDDFYEPILIYEHAKLMAESINWNDQRDRIQAMEDEHLDTLFPQQDATAMETSAVTVTPLL